MGEVVCIVGRALLLVGCLGGLVLTFDLDGMVNKNQGTSGFLFKVMLVGSLGVSGPCTLQLYYVK